MFISQELVLAEKPACHASLRGWSSQCFPSLHYFSNANAPPADCSKVRALKIALCNRRQASTKGNNRNGFDDRQSRIRQSIPLNGQTLAAIDRGSGDGEFFFWEMDFFFFVWPTMWQEFLCAQWKPAHPSIHARTPSVDSRTHTHAPKHPGERSVSCINFSYRRLKLRHNGTSCMVRAGWRSRKDDW